MGELVGRAVTAVPTMSPDILPRSTEELSDDETFKRESVELLHTNPGMYVIMATRAAQMAQGDPVLHQQLFRVQQLLLRDIHRQEEVDVLEYEFSLPSHIRNIA